MPSGRPLFSRPLTSSPCSFLPVSLFRAAAQAQGGKDGTKSTFSAPPPISAAAAHIHSSNSWVTRGWVFSAGWLSVSLGRGPEAPETRWTSPRPLPQGAPRKTVIM